MASYILNEKEKESKPNESMNEERPSFVIGYDHRHNSEKFAKLSASVFLEAGFNVYLYRRIVHTPMVPFAIRKLNTAGGVMVTASHNPKQDNGYKVYWGNGAQIIPPHDKGIAARILSHGLTPKTWSTTLPDTHPNCIDMTEDLINAYFTAWKPNMSIPSNFTVPPNLRYTYTAMHGVGYEFVKRMVADMGFPPVIPVPSQQNPDPDFPTVPFPNRSYIFLSLYSNYQYF